MMYDFFTNQKEIINGYFIISSNNNEVSNASFLVVVIVSISISLVIKGFRKIAHNIALNQNIEPAKFKKIVDEIVTDAKENSSNDKSKMDEWEQEILKRYDTGEIKSLGDLVKFIDSSRNEFLNNIDSN